MRRSVCHGSSSLFILKNLSALIGLETNVYRSNSVEGALRGAFILTGLGLNWWKGLEDVHLSKELTRITPLEGDRLILLEKFKKWKELTKF